jgi:hemerythrin-like domain-containing protein
MKRSEELAPLSRDHHKALHAALQLRCADAERAAEAVDAFLGFWDEHGQRHFEIEERLLLPGFAHGGGDPRHPIVARVLTDHVEIRSRARVLNVDSRPSELRDLGERLSAHVRLEEEELFPLIERTLDPPALAKLGEEVAATERAPDPANSWRSGSSASTIQPSPPTGTGS